jgi:hypothetical protein
MKRTLLGEDDDVQAVAARLERGLPPGTEIQHRDHETLSIRQGRMRRCAVRVRNAAEGRSVEIRGDGSAVPLPALALLLGHLNERRLGTAVVAALDGTSAPGSAG